MGVSFINGEDNMSNPMTTIVEGDVINTLLLNRYALQDNHQETKVAYLESGKAGRTKMNKIFYTYNFRDTDGNMIRGVQFNLKDEEETGIVNLSLTKKLVKVLFTSNTDEYGLSLEVEKMFQLEEGYLTLEDYFKPLNNLDPAVDYIQNRLNTMEKSMLFGAQMVQHNKLLEELKEASYTTNFGRKGGLLLLTTQLIQSIESLPYEKILLDQTIMIALVTMIFEGRRHKDTILNDDVFDLGISKTKILQKLDKFWSVFETNYQTANGTLQGFAVAKEGRNTFNAMLGIDTAKCMSALIFIKVYNCTVELNGFYREYIGMLDNSYVKLGDITLVKSNR